MLHTHLSNRPQALVAALTALLRIDPLPLLEREAIVVPSTALARWLGLRLADGLGIATQTEFVFPAAYVWQLFGRVLPDVAAHDPFDRAALVWRLLRLLGASRAAEVRHYLTDDDGTRQFELASQLAALFDRYLVERPDWIAAWNAGQRLALGDDEGWQAGLWQALAAELGGASTGGHPRERFLAALRDTPGLRARLPRRLCLFCVEAMPALYWEVCTALAAWIDVHLFVLAPCHEYWGDVTRRREQLRAELRQPEIAALADTGHPLLASLGRARQHATVRLVDTAAQVPGDERDYFAGEMPASLLGALQRDLRDLERRGGATVDASLQIHACHGAQREAEVLLDRLLDRFATLPDLQPADILILTPDIETYGPIVAAVLGNAPAARRIPSAVADRPLAMASLWRALRQLCVVAVGEMEAESVLALLEEAALRRAFDIDAEEVPRLREWVKEAGIRWGIDAVGRVQRGLPADATHTWRAGLQRLLLGVALPDAPERLWQGMLPVRGIEGERADLLGRFAGFVETLFELNGKLGARETASAWCRILAATAERCLLPDETEEAQAQRLRETLARLDAEARQADAATRLPLAVLLRELDTRLAGQAPAQAFVSGMATIAALQPGRPVAARVVCLVGMNDGAWPRPRTPLGFDLMAAHPRSGDRNRRGEERYAFLEALLCAGDALIVTYAGRDPRSNLELPPAAPLAELIDTLAAMTGADAGRLVVQHPLQPFGATYFDGSDARLFSHDAEHCPTGTPSSSPPPAAFVAGDTALIEVEGDEIELDELKRFFSHPVRYFLRERLSIRIEEDEGLLDGHEPFVPNRLEAFQLRAAQIAGLDAGQSAAETAALLHARGWLPQGVAGTLTARAARAAAESLWAATADWRDPARPAAEVSFAAAGLRVNGRLDGLGERGLWRVRPGRLRARDRLALWLDHLLLNIARPPGVALASLLVATDGEFVLGPVADAPALLADLLDVFRVGQTRTLPFYAETSWAWQAGKSWQRAWSGDRHNGKPGERDDAYISLALRDRVDDPHGPAFRQLAARVYGPLGAGGGDD